MNKAILEAAIKKYGELNQMDMVIEECAELIKAINKLKRKGGINNLGVRPPSQNTTTEYSQLYYELCSEVADVKIMLAQAELMLSKEAIDLSVERKMERLANRLGLYPFDSSKPYVKVAIGISEGYWYSNKPNFYNVKQVTCIGEMKDVEGFGGADPKEVVMVSEGEYEGNLIYIKHCLIYKKSNV